MVTTLDISKQMDMAGLALKVRDIDVSGNLSVAGNFSNIYTPEYYGAVGDGVTDDTSAIQDAIDALHSSGGGSLYFRSNTYIVSTLYLKSRVNFSGAGRECTIIKQIAGTYGPVIGTDNFSSLIGGSIGDDTLRTFKISDLTIDGNRANQTLGADIHLQNGLSLAAHDFTLENVNVINCFGNGIYASIHGTSGSSSRPKETASYKSVFVDNVGAHGIRHDGPTDSYFTDVMIRNASQQTDDTYYGFFIEGRNCRVQHMHVWCTASVSNRPAFALRDEYGTSEMQECHFEGSRQIAYMGGALSKILNSKLYANYSTDPLLVVDANGVIIIGTDINASTSYDAECVRFGSAATPTHCKIDAYVSSEAQYPINLYGDGGANDFTFRIWGASSSDVQMYTGTLSATSTLVAVRQGNSAITRYEAILPSRTSVKVKLEDDFLGDVIADQWAGMKGSDASAGVPTVITGSGGALNGLCRLTAGSNAANTLATNGSLLDSLRTWRAASGGLSIEARIRMNDTTKACVFFGLTDSNAVLEMPIEGVAGTNTFTTTASDAVGIVYDPRMNTDVWWLHGVKADVDATAQNSGFAPAATTFEIWRVELDTSGTARFFRNGLFVGSAMSNAVTTTTQLTPVVCTYGIASATCLIDIDYISLEMNRI